MKMMRQMKAVEAKGGKLSDLPPPPRSNYDHYVQCRYCGRNYAPEVAERHIPKCANIVNKPGGIKPSRIQEKYIGGTGSSGANKSSTYIQPKSNTALKPNFSTNSSMKGSNPVGIKAAKVEEPTSPFSNPFGSNYKPSSNSKATRPTPNEQKPSSNMKPNLKGSNKYW